MSGFEKILFIVLQGLATGSLYGLIALGIVMVYKTSEVLNFAHGNMGMVIAFISYRLMEKFMTPMADAIGGAAKSVSFLSWMGDGFIVSVIFALVLLVSFIAAFVLGMIIELTIRSAEEPNMLGLIVITIGWWLMLDGAAIPIFGTQDHRMPEPLTNFKIYKLGNVPLNQLDVIIFSITIAIIIIMFLFFRYARVGVAMRATSQNVDAARLMAINTNRVFAFTWGISSMLGALAGILTASKFFLNNSMMLYPFLKAFAAATLGGLTSLPGAIVGGWILGVSENLFGRYISMDLKTPFAFLVIVLVLAIRPSGLLARHYEKKV